MTLVFEFPVKKISRKKGSTASQHLITLYNHVENAKSFRDPILFCFSCSPLLQKKQSLHMSAAPNKIIHFIPNYVGRASSALCVNFVVFGDMGLIIF